MSPGHYYLTCNMFFKPGSVSARCGAVMLNAVSDKVRKQLLDQHNQLRRKVAKGLQKDQPPAANMREMVRKDDFVRRSF